MSSDMRRVADCHSHIFEAIERVRRYTDGVDEAAFLQSQIVQDAVIRNFEIIGEACRNIERNDPTFASAHPELPLTSADEMRNALAHAYLSEWIWKWSGKQSKTTCRSFRALCAHC